MFFHFTSDIPNGIPTASENPIDNTELHPGFQRWAALDNISATMLASCVILGR